MVALADHTEMATLHMLTSDPFRTPTFTPFADPNWFFFATGGATPTACATPSACAFIPARTSQSFAWNHGDIQDEIASTWIGIVGPGVRDDGIDATTWSDHTDLRPTMMSLLGLKDDYVHDGRLLAEALTGKGVPAAVKKGDVGRFVQLAAIYKQLDASFGAFAMDTLHASTAALASNDAGDATYNSVEGQIQNLTSQRNAVAAQIVALLNGATFNGQMISSAQATNLTAQAQSLLDQAHALAAAY
jgi:hypothetical protein